MVPSRYQRKAGKERPRDIFYISLEGEITEVRYFEQVKALLRHRFVLELLPPKDGKSSPQHVLDRLLDSNLQKDSQCHKWYVGDVDRWLGNGELQKVVSDCRSQGIHLAISNPCFEIWLLLHFLEPDHLNFADGGRPKTSRQFKKLYGRIKNEGGRDFFEPGSSEDQVRQAGRRAKAHDPDPKKNWPQAKGTHVYKLIERWFEI